MGIDKKNKFSDKLYYNYCKDTIERLDYSCELYINKLLFYRYILNSDFDEKELMNGNISNNLNGIISEINEIMYSDFLIEITEYLKQTKNELSWDNFRNGKLNKEMLRELKLFKLIK